MKIVTVVGARPQFVKASVVSQALRRRTGVHEVLLHTGQHYDDKLSQIFFDELRIPAPDYHLGAGSGNHGAQTAKMLAGIEEVLLNERPDWVLVYGDTNSTLAGALAAAKLHIPVAHVEAGLRSYNRRMPEEINRVLTDHAADLLLAPTRTAQEILQREGIDPTRVRYVGDVMYDVALAFGKLAAERSAILQQLELQPRGYVLATVHRPDNTDDPQRLATIAAALDQLALEIPVVLPIHPRTKKMLAQLPANLLPGGVQRVRLIEPVGYLDMARLEANARLVVTDSGGVQKEAYFHGVPCLTLRGETEWVELVESGGQRLHVPTDVDSTLAAVQAVLAEPFRDTRNLELFGDGQAAEHIAAAIAIH